MRHYPWAALFAAAIVLPAQADPPQLRSVTLSSAGVGQYTFAAHLDGPGEVALEVALNEVDDLLASLRVLDPSGGVATVHLPGRQSLPESVRTLPFPVDDLRTPEDLLQALTGAEVRLPNAGLSGSIITVTRSEERRPDGMTFARHRLSIATAKGLATVVLEDQPEIEFVSPQLRADIAFALRTIAASRAQDRRTLMVALPGAGPRHVQLGYIVPAPVWKASYRLTLSADGPARVQGYAIVENRSGQDWHGVRVTLTSGQPVVFHQALYQALFANRPEAPVAASRRLTPLADEGAQAPPAMPAPPPPPGRIAPQLEEERLPAADGQLGTTAVQEATQVQFQIDAPVDAPSGQSMLLPILDRPVPARRTALFNPETDGLHPFVALQLTNDTGFAWPPGLATLYAEAGGFVGNALLPATQPGEDRLLSFASDLYTRVTRTEAGTSSTVASHAARGLMTLTLKDVRTSIYSVTTAPGEARHMLFEERARDGWTVTEPAGATRTPTRWRVTRDIPAGTTQDVTIRSEHIRSQIVALGAVTPPQLLEYVGNAALDPAARAAFTRIGDLRAELARRTAATAALKQQIATVIADQDRIRANLAATTQNQALQKRYTDSLQQQEDDLAALRTRQASAQTAQDAQQAALDNDLATLSF